MGMFQIGYCSSYLCDMLCVGADSSYARSYDSARKLRDASTLSTDGQRLAQLLARLYEIFDEMPQSRVIATRLMGERLVRPVLREQVLNQIVRPDAAKVGRVQDLASLKAC